MRPFKRKKTEESPARSPKGSTTHAPVFSYYSNRSTESGERVRLVDKPKITSVRRNSTWLKYLPSILSLGVIFAAVAYMTTLGVNPKVVVASNPNEPAVLQPIEIYENAAASAMKDSIFNRSKLTINTDKIAERLESEFPELGDIVVTIPLINRRPIIQTQPATPTLILVGNGGSFVINDEGKPILKPAQLASSVREKLPVLSDSSDSQIKLGEQHLTTELVTFVATVHSYLKVKGIEIETFTLPAVSNELHIKPAGKGYYIKFNTEADSRVQVGSYLAVEERLISEGKVPTEYIDVRVEERAYIK